VTAATAVLTLVAAVNANFVVVDNHTIFSSAHFKGMCFNVPQVPRCSNEFASCSFRIYTSARGGPAFW